MALNIIDPGMWKPVADFLTIGTGTTQAVLVLEAAGALFGSGTTPAENATGLGLLAGLVAKYHVLTAYAADLGVTLDDPGALGNATGVLAALSGSVPDERFIA